MQWYRPCAFFDNKWMASKNPTHQYLNQLKKDGINPDKQITNIYLEMFNYFHVCQHFEQKGNDKDYAGNLKYNNYEKLSDKNKIIPNKAPTVLKKKRYKFGIKIKKYSTLKKWFSYISRVQPACGINFNDYAGESRSSLNQHLDGHYFGTVWTSKPFNGNGLDVQTLYGGSRTTTVTLSLVHEPNTAIGMPHWLGLGRILPHQTNATDLILGSGMTFIPRNHSLTYQLHAMCQKHSQMNASNGDWTNDGGYWNYAQSCMNGLDRNYFNKYFKYYGINCDTNAMRWTVTHVRAVRQAKIAQIGVATMLKGMNDVLTTSQRIKDRVKVIKIGALMLGNKLNWVRQANLAFNGDINDNKLTYDKHSFIQLNKHNVKTTEDLFDYLINIKPNEPMDINSDILCLLKLKMQYPYNEIFMSKVGEIIEDGNQILQQDYL